MGSRGGSRKAKKGKETTSWLPKSGRGRKVLLEVDFDGAGPRSCQTEESECGDSFVICEGPGRSSPLEPPSGYAVMGGPVRTPPATSASPATSPSLATSVAPATSASRQQGAEQSQCHTSADRRASTSPEITKEAGRDTTPSADVSAETDASPSPGKDTSANMDMDRNPEAEVSSKADKDADIRVEASAETDKAVNPEGDFGDASAEMEMSGAPRRDASAERDAGAKSEAETSSEMSMGRSQERCVSADVDVEGESDVDIETVSDADTSAEVDRVTAAAKLGASTLAKMGRREVPMTMSSAETDVVKASGGKVLIRKDKRETAKADITAAVGRVEALEMEEALETSAEMGTGRFPERDVSADVDIETVPDVDTSAETDAVSALEASAPAEMERGDCPEALSSAERDTVTALKVEVLTKRNKRKIAEADMSAAVGRVYSPAVDDSEDVDGGIASEGGGSPNLDISAEMESGRSTEGTGSGCVDAGRAPGEGGSAETDTVGAPEVDSSADDTASRDGSAEMDTCASTAARGSGDAGKGADLERNYTVDLDRAVSRYLDASVQVDVCPISAEMDVFRVRGNAAFKKGAMREAVRLFTAGIEKGAGWEGTESDGLRAVLYSNRSAAHACARAWRLSLDDAVRALSIRPETVKAWGRVIAALCGLRMPALAREVLRESKEKVAKEQHGGLEMTAEAALADARDGGTNAALAAMRVPSHPWLCIRAGAMLLTTANSSGKLKSLRALRTSGGIDLLTLSLNKVETGGKDPCCMTASAAYAAYTAMGDACKLWDHEAVVLLLKGKGIWVALREMCERDVEEVCASVDLSRLHLSQLLLVMKLRSHMSRPLIPTSGMLESVELWAQIAGMLREILLKGEEIPLYVFVALLRTFVFFDAQEGRANPEVGDMVAGLLEGVTGWFSFQMQGKHAISSGFVSHIIFQTATALLQKDRGLWVLLRALGGGIRGEVRLRALTHAWVHHRSPEIAREGTQFLKVVLPKHFQEKPSKEIARALARQFCRGACWPTKQEKHRGDFALYHQWQGEGCRRYFCSDACFDQQMLAVPSARLRYATSRSKWNAGVADIATCKGSSVVDGFNLCLASVLIEPCVPEIVAGLPFVTSEMLLSLEYSSRYPRQSSLLSASLDLVGMMAQPDLQDNKTPSTHGFDRTFELAKDLLEQLTNLQFHPEQDYRWLQKALADRTGDSNTGNVVGNVTELSNAAELINLRVWEMRAWTVLYFIRDETYLANRAVEVLQAWREPSPSNDRAGPWIARGLLAALLTVLPDTKACAECATAGREAWVKSWRHVAGCADSEELGLHLVLTWLAHEEQSHRLLRAAAAAERKAKQLWGEEVDRQWERLPPCLKEILESSPLGQNAPPPKPKRCSACGEAKRRERAGEPRVVLKKCGDCQRDAYCSQDCQRADWEKHKIACRQLPPKTLHTQPRLQEPSRSRHDGQGSDQESHTVPHYHGGSHATGAEVWI